MKVRLLHPVTISFLVIVLLIAAISIFSSPQSVSAQDEMTATITETAFVPLTVPYFSTMTTTVTATVTSFPVVTFTPTGTQTLRPTVTFTPTYTTTPTMKPTVTPTTTATIQTYIVSGSLGVKGAGANISYTGGAIFADSQGNYSFSIPAGWMGTITPSKTGYKFLPSSITITSPVSANLPNQNFTTKPSNK